MMVGGPGRSQEPQLGMSGTVHTDSWGLFKVGHHMNGLRIGDSDDAWGMTHPRRGAWMGIAQDSPARQPLLFLASLGFKLPRRCEFRRSDLVLLVFESAVPCGLLCHWCATQSRDTSLAQRREVSAPTILRDGGWPRARPVTHSTSGGRPPLLSRSPCVLTLQLFDPV